MLGKWLWSPPTPKDLSLNPAITNFTKIIFLLLTVEKVKLKISGIVGRFVGRYGPFKEVFVVLNLPYKLVSY